MGREIIGDATAVICFRPVGIYTGNMLYDERVVLDEGGLSRYEVARRSAVEA